MKLDHHKPPKKHLLLALLKKKFTEKNMGVEYMAGISFLKWDPCVGQMQSCSGQTLLLIVSQIVFKLNHGSKVGGCFF
jgi:hypothetical protein